MCLYLPLAVSRRAAELSDMATRLSEQTSIFGGVFFVSKSLLGM